MAGILEGTRVLDFGRYIAAPFCCQLLADMGAEVIRVERPGGEPDRQRGPLDPGGQSLYFVAQLIEALDVDHAACARAQLS